MEQGVSMKAFILAAGRGTRLGNLAQDKPKGMLEFLGKPLIQWQIENYRRVGIDEIFIVTGFAAEKINFEGVPLIHNAHYAETNMVESFLTARHFFSGPAIVSYADILFEERILRGLLDQKVATAVTVDLDWKTYWSERYGRLDFDLESLQLASSGKILELGSPVSDATGIDARYVGLVSFSEQGLKRFVNTYDTARAVAAPGKWRHSKNFENAYMTDLLQEMIDKGEKVFSYSIRGGWIEFDTEQDYGTYQKWIKEDKLQQFWQAEEILR